MTSRPSGFTLIELLLVIAIIATLVGLLMPALAGARSASRSAACLSNARSIAQGLAMYEATYKETFPCWSGWQIFGGPSADRPDWHDADGPGWMEQVMINLTSPGVLACPGRPADQAPFGYFLQSRYTFGRSGRAYTSLRAPEVLWPDRFVLLGDCDNPVLYASPYGQTANGPDCDQDDATQPAVFFAGAKSAHQGRSHLVFLDAHAGAFSQFEPARMTFHARRMNDWLAAGS